MGSNVPSMPPVDINPTPTPSISGPTGYAQRILKYTFELGKGQFGDSGFNQLSVGAPPADGKPGLRSSVQIKLAQMPATGQATIRIDGLTLDHINQLTKTGWYNYTYQNKIAIQAGDVKAGLTTIFNGQIIEAYPEFSNQPDVGFVIVAIDYGPNGAIKMQSVEPVNFTGSVPIETALTKVLQPTGLTVENNGVNTVISRPYLWGTPWMQAEQLIKAADCFGVLDSSRNILAIYPKTSFRAGEAITISPATGMIGYPEYEFAFIRLRTLFNPAVKGVGTLLNVQSQLESAQGMWGINTISYNLAVETPSGPWEMLIAASPKNFKA